MLHTLQRTFCIPLPAIPALFLFPSYSPSILNTPAAIPTPFPFPRPAFHSEMI